MFTENVIGFNRRQKTPKKSLAPPHSQTDPSNTVTEGSSVKTVFFYFQSQISMEFLWQGGNGGSLKATQRQTHSHSTLSHPRLWNNTEYTDKRPTRLGLYDIAIRHINNKNINTFQKYQ